MHKSHTHISLYIYEYIYIYILTVQYIYGLFPNFANVGARSSTPFFLALRCLSKAKCAFLVRLCRVLRHLKLHLLCGGEDDITDLLEERGFLGIVVARQRKALY